MVQVSCAYTSNKKFWWSNNKFDLVARALTLASALHIRCMQKDDCDWGPGVQVVASANTGTTAYIWPQGT